MAPLVAVATTNGVVRLLGVFARLLTMLMCIAPISWLFFLQSGLVDEGAQFAADVVTAEQRLADVRTVSAATEFSSVVAARDVAVHYS